MDLVILVYSENALYTIIYLKKRPSLGICGLIKYEPNCKYSNFQYV